MKRSTSEKIIREAQAMKANAGPAKAGTPNPEGTAKMEVRYLLRKEVRRDEEQPRKVFEEGKLQELAESIKAVGIRQPLQVEWVTGLELKAPDLISKNWSVAEGPKILFNSEREEEARGFIAARPGGFYRIVDGERRWRAAELAGVERVPCMIVDTNSPDWEKQKLAIQVVLNQQHENLTALEEAAAYKKEIEQGRHTAESLYPALGVSRAHLFGRLRLNNLKGKGLEALKQGAISPSVAGLVAMVPEHRHEELIGEVTERGMNGEVLSFREAQNLIERDYVRQLKEATFEVKSENYHLLAAQHKVKGVRNTSCEACPLRSGNLEGCELKNPNVCTDPVCFEGKTDAASAEAVARAEAEGKKVLKGKEAEGLFQEDYNGEAHLRGSRGYIELSARCEPLGWDYKNNWRAALKKAFDNPEAKPEVTLVVDPAGELRELVREDEAVKLLWGECGHKKKDSYSSSGISPAERQKMAERQKKEKRYRKAAERATGLVLAKLVTEEKINEKLWRFIAEGAYHETSIDTHDFVAKRMGIARTQNEARPALEKAIKMAGSWFDLARIAVDLLVCARWDGGGWHKTEWSKEFLAVCELAKVSPEKLLKEDEAAAAAKQESKVKKAESKLKAEVIEARMKVERKGKAARKIVEKAARTGDAGKRGAAFTKAMKKLRK